eukprot:gene13627-28942_t
MRAQNANGYGPYTSFITVTPQVIPGPPMDVHLLVVSGSQLEVFYSPPASIGRYQNISKYTIEWDTTPLFKTARVSGTCSTSGHGFCDVRSSTLNGRPPYSFLISRLIPTTRYYVRVAARNAVPVQQTDPTGAIPDNTNWSNTLSAVTTDQPAGAPIYVYSTVSGPTNAQLEIMPPVRDGGQAITTYVVEWDTVTTFDSSLYDSLHVAASTIYPLYTGGPVIYELSNLTTATSYWIRVSCVTAIGRGPPTITPITVTPAGKPNPPANVNLATVNDQTTPVTQVDVSWTAPSGSAADGGSAITGYLVEWWTLRNIPEVQLVRFTSDVYPPNVNGSFIMKFGPAPGLSYATGLLRYNLNPMNIREQLMNIGYSGVIGRASNFVIGDVAVTRQLIPGTGYQWSITFKSSVNVGDQVPLATSPVATRSEHVDNYELVTGRRAGGFAERQIISIISYDTNSSSTLGGWFRLSFNSSYTYTPWFPVDASAEHVQRGLRLLPPLRVVSVDRSIVYSRLSASKLYAGYEWTVTFDGDRGNMPAIILDTTYLYTSSTSFVGIVYDGDNSIDPNTGSKLSNAFPGELPSNYSYQYVSANTFSLSVDNLVTGTEYFFAVSAINSYGIGPVGTAPSGSITPPLQVPQPPTNVSVNVNYGSATTLIVKYSAPASTGGTPILKYRVEVDSSPEFSNAIYNEFSCPEGNLHSAYKVKTSGYTDDPIIGGYFTLKLAVNGFNYITDFIPYDATALSSDESGIRVLLKTFAVTFPSNNAATMTAPYDVSKLVFKNDHLQFGDQIDPERTYIIQSVASSYPYTIVLDSPVLLRSAQLVQSVYRYSGGRGNVQNSKIACVKDDTTCGVDRRQHSGSVESKLEMLSQAIKAGVAVDRDEPDSTNGMVWRITFLDDSPPDPYNFNLGVNASFLQTAKGNVGTVSITQLAVGKVFSSCTGSQTVPTDKALTNGQYYYGRVFSVNEVGFSLAEIAPIPEKPMVVPGIPTSVVLSVVSDTEMRVKFNPPDSDGGDTITSYLVEYSTRSDFSDAFNSWVSYLTKGPPFAKTIQGLTKGVSYYVRVSAGNSQGYGDPT